jgi:hypothetical protein
MKFRTKRSPPVSPHFLRGKFVEREEPQYRYLLFLEYKTQTW